MQVMAAAPTFGSKLAAYVAHRWAMKELLEHVAEHAGRVVAPLSRHAAVGAGGGGVGITGVGPGVGLGAGPGGATGVFPWKTMG
jgi:hypothetical protein